MWMHKLKMRIHLYDFLQHLAAATLEIKGDFFLAYMPHKNKNVIGEVVRRR